MTGKVLTANRVTDGEVVFFTEAHDWSPKIADALVAEDESTCALLDEQVKQTEAGTEVTDAYLFDVKRIDGLVRPAHIRERIRTLGPTVRADLGKQSDGNGGTFQVLD